MYGVYSVRGCDLKDSVWCLWCKGFCVVLVWCEGFCVVLMV